MLSIKTIGGVLAIVFGGVMTSAYAEIQIACGDFKKNADGSWLTTSEITLSNDGMKLDVSRGTQFVSGAHFGRLDLYAILERNCGHQ